MKSYLDVSDCASFCSEHQTKNRTSIPKRTERRTQKRNTFPTGDRCFLSGVILTGYHEGQSGLITISEVSVSECNSKHEHDLPASFFSLFLCSDFPTTPRKNMHSTSLGGSRSCRSSSARDQAWDEPHPELLALRLRLRCLPHFGGRSRRSCDPNRMAEAFRKRGRRPNEWSSWRG